MTEPVPIDVRAVLVTWLDLLAFVTAFGALASSTWIVPPAAAHPDAAEIGVARTRLWRLLGTSLVLLTLTSLAELAVRVSAMSGRSVAEIWPVLPTAVTRTHYGQLWLLRPVALAALGLGWSLGRARPGSRTLSAAMLGGCLLVVAARCATGHGADQGDLTLPEIADGIHLVAASLWGGSLIAVSAAVLPPVLRSDGGRPAVLADLAGRFSTLAGLALGGVLATGAYNAVHELGSFSALWGTPYGRTLAVKLLLVAAMVALGAANRYLSVPALRLWAGRGRQGGWLMYRWVAEPYLDVVRRRGPGSWIASRFSRRVVAEAVLAAGVLAATSLLLQNMPARHVHPSSSPAATPGHLHGHDGAMPAGPNR